MNTSWAVIPQRRRHSAILLITACEPDIMIFHVDGVVLPLPRVPFKPAIAVSPFFR
jgi:hypothetical protein